MTSRAWGLFALLSVLWGIPYLFIKLAVAEVPVPVLVFTRALIGALCLLPFVLRGDALTRIAQHWRGLIAFALIEMAIPWGLIVHGEIKIHSSTAGLLIAATPILTVLLTRFTGDGGPLGARRIAGFALGFGGVFVLAAQEFGGDFWSILEILAAAACYAIGSVVASRWLKDIAPPLAVAVCLVISALCYAPVALLSWPPALPSVTAISSILLLATFCTAFAFVAFFSLIREAGPDRAVVITYTAPAVAVAAGVAFLSEPLTATMLIAFALVVGGSVLATGKSAA